MRAAQRAAIHEAEKYKERLAVALKAAKICVFEVDLLHQKYTFFENSEDIFGVTGDVILRDVQPYSELEPEAYQRAVSDYFSHEDDFEVIDRAFACIFRGQSTTYEARMRAGGSDYIWCKLDVTPVMENGVPAKMIGVITDISDLKARTENLEKAAQRDGFTGLYNKNVASGMIREILHRNPGQKHALVLTDIDNFKHYNDTYGHANGDKVIKAVAETLEKNFRRTDVVGRFGGDEFILFIRNVPDGAWLAQKLQGLTSCGDGEAHCTNSIGVSVFPDDALEFEGLFQKADEALYEAKNRKQNYTFFSDIVTGGAK